MAYSISCHGSSHVVKWAKGGFWKNETNVSLGTLCESIAEVMNLLEGVMPEAKIEIPPIWPHHFKHMPLVQLFREAAQTPVGISSFHIQHSDKLKKVFLQDGNVANIALGKGKLVFYVTRTRYTCGTGSHESPLYSMPYLEFIGVCAQGIRGLTLSESHQHAEEISCRLNDRYPEWV